MLRIPVTQMITDGDDDNLSVEETDPELLSQVPETDANAEVFCDTLRDTQDADTDSGCCTGFCGDIRRLELWERISNLFVCQDHTIAVRDDLRLSQEDTPLVSAQPSSCMPFTSLIDDDLKLSQEETSLSSVRPFLSNCRTYDASDNDPAETANTRVLFSEPTVT